MNYKISSVKELVTDTNYLNLNIENNLIKEDVEKIIKLLSDDMFETIIIEINSNIDINYFKMIMDQFQDKITEIKFNISKISEKNIQEYAIVLSKSFLFMKVDEIHDYIVFELKFEKSNDVPVKNNLNLINNIKISKITLQQEDRIHFFNLIETLNQHVSELQNEIKKQEQKMNALEKRINAGAFDSQNIRYNNLMEKYKDTLKRLENLRNSRLGKLQIKYWDLKG
ncbi:hypothetical protein [Macrococcus animalis]|uniref:hypothetical protein n=1 Tax=Macrococcus animalis TaxID=3395467 RepID=UPI0039BDAA75